MNRRIPHLALWIAGGVMAGMSWLLAQNPPTVDSENEGSTLTFDATNEIWRFQWWGREGRAYYIQHSEDLVLWNWVPVIEVGDDSVKEWGLTTDADRFFLRLRHVPFSGGDPALLDSDGNGLPDLWEIEHYGTIGLDAQSTAPGKGTLTFRQVYNWGLDPHQESTNNIGLPDDWLVRHGIDPLTADPESDLDNDGLTLRDEFEVGTDPTNPDTDGDGFLDGLEAVPTEPMMTVRAAQEVRYALIDLGANYSAHGVNDSGEVLLRDGQSAVFLWKQGQLHPLNLSSNDQICGPLTDGSVYFTPASNPIIESSTEYGSLNDIDYEQTNSRSAAILKKWNNSVSDVAYSWEEFKRWRMASELEEIPLFDNGDTLAILDSSAQGILDAGYQSAMSAVLGYLPGQKAQIYQNEANSWTRQVNDGHQVTFLVSKSTSAFKDGFPDGMVRWISGGSRIWGFFDAQGSLTLHSSAWSAGHQYLNPPYDPETDDYIYDSHTLGSGGEHIGKLMVDVSGKAAWTTASGDVKKSEGILTDCRELYDINSTDAAEGSYVLGQDPAGSAMIWCHNQGEFAQKSLNGLHLTSGDEWSKNQAVIGRRISSNLVVPAGRNLWRNSRVRDVHSLCGNPEGWANFHVSQVSPKSNLLIGGAIKDENNDGLFQTWINNAPGPDKHHAVLLLPIELVDTKDGVLDDQVPQGTTITAAMRDVSIEPKKDANDKRPQTVAWIDPHGAANEKDPEMPWLTLRFRGAEEMGLKIRWKLKVEYKRPNGRKLPEDKVVIPDAEGWVTENLDGAVEIYNHAMWKEEIEQKGYFGGEAELVFQLLKADESPLGEETKWLFYIGGKNPAPQKCRTFITEASNEIQPAMAWFAYAIAKHESKDYNGANSRYNQFWNASGRFAKVDHHAGEVLWVNNPGEGPPKGFGLFQVTGNKSDSKADIPRKQLWNWQDNVRGGLDIVAVKRGIADRYFSRIQRRSAQHKTAFENCPPPEIQVGTHTFSSPDAIQVYCYNGTGSLNGKPAPIDARYPFDPAKPCGLGGDKRWFWNPHNVAGGEPYIRKVERELEQP